MRSIDVGLFAEAISELIEQNFYRPFLLARLSLASSVKRAFVVEVVVGRNEL
jgi:hypothetical protein